MPHLGVSCQTFSDPLHYIFCFVEPGSFLGWGSFLCYFPTTLPPHRKGLMASNRSTTLNLEPSMHWASWIYLFLFQIFSLRARSLSALEASRLLFFAIQALTCSCDTDISARVSIIWRTRIESYITKKEKKLMVKLGPTPRRLLHIHNRGFSLKSFMSSGLNNITVNRALTPKPPLNRDNGPKGPSQTLSPATSLQDWIFWASNYAQ